MKDGGKFDFGFEDKLFTSVAPGRNQFSTAIYAGMKIKSVMFKTGNESKSGGYGFSVKLEPNPPNGKSCQVVFGDMSANEALTKNAPASCEDLQLAIASPIRVSKHNTLV